MSMATTHDSDELRGLLPAAVLAAMLPLVAVLAGLAYAQAGVLWWLVLGVAAYAVVFPLTVRGVASLIRDPEMHDDY